MNAQFSVQPVSGVQPVPNSSSLSVEIIYLKSVSTFDKAANDSVQQTITIFLDVEMKGSTILEDLVGKTIHANVLAADGALLLSRSIENVQGNFTLILNQQDTDSLKVKPNSLPADISATFVNRQVRLVPAKSDRIDFRSSAVMVSPVMSLQAIEVTGITSLLPIAAGTIVSKYLGSEATDPLTKVVWTPAHLAIDGTFTFTLVSQSTTGWVWWLSGEQEVIGFVPEDVSKQPDRAMAIALPKVFPLQKSGAENTGNGCQCDSNIPINVTEAELVNNPGIYTEDPGSFCKPFSNPERVLSEKSFSVIARVTQPQIGVTSSVKSRTLKISGVSHSNPSAVSTTNVLIDKIQVGHDLLSEYVTFANSLPTGRGQLNANNPLQWEDDIAQYQAASISLGHILDFRVRWRSNGYSLGKVAKTLTLAPRQVKRIQKIEWERNERAKRAERTQFTEQENDSNTRERDFDDQVSANLSEWARGSSHSDSEAIAGGIGFFASGILGGIGGGAGSSNSSSQQQGGRNTTATEHQRLRDAIKRHGDSLRKFESTVINEVHEEENVTGTTEVIRNINYAHSITVIYYQILRHLKVTTEFAGARQCVFIPFSIKPFTISRAYRWRESIQRHIRSQAYGRALRYLKDVVTNFANSDILPGTRGSQQLTYIRGSIFVQLAVERPKDTADGKYDDTKWNGYKQLLDTPAFSIFGILSVLNDAQRDQYFQANFAPGIAAKWANKLTITIGSSIISIDSTLATRYQFNRTVRIDFVIPVEYMNGLRRTDLQTVTINAMDGLPPGSVANVTGMSLSYSTARFQRSIVAQTGVNDLIQAGTGIADFAQLQFPLDAWESVNERMELIQAVNDLVEHLNENVEFYHKAIWWQMDRDRLLMMLDGFYMPFTNNVSLATIVDREPLGIVGNSLVYRVGAASFIQYDNIKTSGDLYNLYAEKQPIADPILVSLPTDGLYAQTVMDECGALEEHFGNLDWALNDKDPDLGAIDASLLASRATDKTAATTPTPFPATIINLQSTPEAPAPNGLQGVLNVVSNPNAFRDFAGLAGTQANAQAALTTAAGLAMNFGNQAASLELAKMAKSQEATRTADQKLASIQRAKEKGLTTPEEASSQAKEVLSAMNPDTPKGIPPHENPAINSVIDTAKTVPGSTVEANTGEGGVKVTIGNGSKEDSASDPLIIEVNVTAQLRAFGPMTDFSGITRLSVRGKNLASGSQLKWSIPKSEVGKYTITQRVTASGISEVEITGIRPGLTNIDVEAIDGGVVVASVKYPLCIPQFFTINDSNPDFNTFIANNSLQAIANNIIAETQSVIERLLLANVNVRLIWASSGGLVPAHIPGNMVTKVNILNTDPSGENSYALADGAVPGGPVGDTVFDEVVSIYPASYLVGANPGGDINLTTNQLVQAIMSIQQSNQLFEAWEVKIFGRLLGETLAHEMYHCLLKVAFNHNIDGSGHEVDTGDIMDRGRFRSFHRRTGINALDASFPADQILAQLTDDGIGVINTITDLSLNRNLSQVHATNPKPPTPPFNTVP